MIQTFARRASQEVIRKILVDLGDEEWKVAGKIAASIVESRPLETTGDLCEAIGKVVPKWSKVRLGWGE